MALPNDFAQHVKSVADIVRVIGETVRLKKSGNNWTGLCPFHQEKTPSFSVHATRQFFNCFGCQEHGDVFSFIMKTENVDFPEALRLVAQKAGVPIPADTPRGPVSPEARLRKGLGELHERAGAFYRRQLAGPEAASLRELIQRRGVTHDSVEEFGLGFAPARGNALAAFLSKEGFSDQLLEASGLVLRRKTGGLFDRFRNRWIFPIAAESGKPVAFAGRALGDDQPKYMNSPETPLYSKSFVLYNLDRSRDAIRRSGQAIIVEGYMDVIAAHQAGAKNVVASCGTALTPSQIKLLARHASQVIMNYDPDTAGVAATDRSLALLLEQDFQVRVLRLGGGLDPDSYVQEKGAEAYLSSLEGAEPFFHYLTARAMELHGKQTPQAKLAAVNFILPYLAHVPNQLIRSELLANVAQKLDVQTGVLRDAFLKAGFSRRSAAESPAGGTAGGRIGEMLRRIPVAEAMLIRLLLEDEQARQQVPILLEEKEIVDEMELGSIISALLEGLPTGSAPDLSAISARLDGPEQQVLSRVAFEDDARPVSLSEINSYLQVLVRKRLHRQRSDLRTEIQSVQQEGRNEQLVELLQRQRELDRRLAELV